MKQQSRSRHFVTTSAAWIIFILVVLSLGTVGMATAASYDGSISGAEAGGARLNGQQPQPSSALDVLTAPSPSQQLASTWERVQDAGVYKFDADITQIRRPLASITNVGRGSQRDQYHLDGLTDLEAQRLEMTLWHQGGAVGDKSSGAQIRVEGDQAYARQGAQPWEKINNFTGLFAPDNDFMAYLVAAVNVQNLGHESRAGIGFTRLSFEIDGPAYANYMRDQMQADMARRGELLVGSRLETPKVYSGMVGRGELWIGEDGLPLRQILQLDFAPEDDEQVSAEVTVNFRNFKSLALAATSVDSSKGALLEEVARIIPGPVTAGEIIAATDRVATTAAPLVAFALITTLLLTALVKSRRSRAFLAALQLTLIISMVFTPLLNGAHAARLDNSQQAKKKAAAERDQKSDMMEVLGSLQGDGAEKAVSLEEIRNDPGADSDGDGYSDVQERILGTNPYLGTTSQVGQTPLAVEMETATPSLALPPDDGLDTDFDGLTDYVEVLLGTSEIYSDTDGDLISDWEEVTGFAYAGETWVTDPLNLDSNKDGLGDGPEWSVGAVAGLPADSDGDGVPDLYDDDNDGDLVPDRIDLSPYTTITNTFDQDNPFSLVLNELNADKFVYVELQLRPTNPDHLQYAYHTIDWPDDKQGNIQDSNSSLEDLRLVPMLEVILPDTSSNLLPLDVLKEYKITVLDAEGGGKALYVPLFLESDNRGAEKVAFNAKMVYNGATHWGDAHQMRLVWIVQANNDVCSAFDESGLCSTYEALDTPQVVHSYGDSWLLTGLNVRENHWSDVATVFEDPAVDTDVHDDSALWLLSHGLDLSFMAGGPVSETEGARLWDVAEIESRFDHGSNGEISDEARWNITNTFSVETNRYTHLDEAVMTTVQTTTVALLNTHFGAPPAEPISPTLLFARQDKYRSFNLDEAGGSGSGGLVDWQGNKLSLNILESKVPLEISATMSWAPYRYDFLEGGWRSYPIELYWSYLGDTIEADMLAEFGDPEVASGAVSLAQMYYAGLVAGVFSVVQIGDGRLQQSFFAKDKALSASVAGGARSGVVFVIKQALDAKRWEPTQFLRAVHAQVKSPKAFTIANGPAAIGSSGLTKLMATLRALGRVKLGLAAGAMLLVAVAVIVGLIFLAEQAILVEYTSGETGPGRIITAVIVGAVMLFIFTVMPIFQIRAFASVYAGTGTKAAYTRAAFSTDSVAKGVKIANVIGLVVTIGIAVGIFIYNVVSNNFEFGSVEFNTLLAQTIAAILIALVLFALSLTLAGTILVGLFTIVDILLLILGVNFSLNGWLTEEIGKGLYHFELTVDQDISTGVPIKTLGKPERGFEQGQTMAFALPVTTTIRHIDPQDARIIPYLGDFYNKPTILETAFKYTLSPFTLSEKVEPGDTAWHWPVVDHVWFGKEMYRTSAVAIPQTSVILQAGINTRFPIYLNTAYSLPGIDCFTIPLPPYVLCLGQTIEGNGSNDIGSHVLLDVFPATLDAFMALDWGGDVPFPVQRDKDHDGLIARAYQGADPNDQLWDFDSDGLSDAYELRLRANGTLLDPANKDTDSDGLSDADELLFGTDPGRRDTDRDGLDDGQEVWHYDSSSQTWTGGWMFTLTYTDTGGTTTTDSFRIFSDPLKSDADDDGISDGIEKALHEADPVAYPFHPNAFNESPVGLYITYSDEDGFVALGQTLTISATVRNNLSTPLYAKGVQTLTLPAELGSAVLGDDFNIFQNQTTSVYTDVLVDETSPNGPISIVANHETRLHNGDLSWRYDWLTTTHSSEDAGDRDPYAVSATSYPDPTSVPTTYALATLEGTFEYIKDTPYASLWGSVTARGATAEIFEPEDVGREHLSILTGGPLELSRPAIACNQAGDCVEVYQQIYWERCANVQFNFLRVHTVNDGNDTGEYIFYHDRAWINGNEGKAGEDIQYNFTRRVCAGDSIWVFEYDPYESDYLGRITPDIYGGPDYISQFLEADGDKVELFYTVEPEPAYRTVWQFLDSDLYRLPSPDNVLIDQPLLVGDPAVASSDNNWLFAYPSTGAAWEQSEIYVLAVQHDGTRLNQSRLDEDELNGYDDHDPDVTWAGTHFLTVWEQDVAGEHWLRLAFVNEDGTVASRTLVDLLPGPVLPSIEYSEQLDQALVAYINGNEINGRIIVESQISDPFNIGSVDLDSGEEFVTEPDVAYDETNNLWIVSWQSPMGSSAAKIHTVALAPGSLSGSMPLTAVLDISSPTLNPDRLMHDLACAKPDAPVDRNLRQFTKCAIFSVDATVTGSIWQDSIVLESTPPWIGGGGVLTGDVLETLIIDNDYPTSAVIISNTLNVTDTFIIGGQASDLTSNVNLVEVKITDSYGYSTGWQPATGTLSWSYAWDVPSADGDYMIETKATDVVGNVSSVSNSVVTLDRSAPTTEIAGDANQIVTPTQVGNRWQVAFSVTASDPQLVHSVEAIVSPLGSGWQTATLSGENWDIAYVLAEIDADGTLVVNPTGSFTLTVRATDSLGNVTSSQDYATLPFRIDTTPPVASLTQPGPEQYLITQTLTLSGRFTDTGAVSSGLKALEINFSSPGETPTDWTEVAILYDSGPEVIATTWEHSISSGREGDFLINLRGLDWQENQTDQGSWWSGWQGEIDTLAPRASMTITLQGNGFATKTYLEAVIYDRNLTEAGLEFPCPVNQEDRGYRNDSLLDELEAGTPQLTSLHLACQISRAVTDPIILRVFDLYGHEREVIWNPTSFAPLTTPLASEASILGLVSTSGAALDPAFGPGESPFIASTVLTPSHESVLTNLSEVVVEGGAYAIDGLKALTMTVNGSFHISKTWSVSPTITNTMWITTWTPAGDGLYTLETVVEDWAGSLQTDFQPVTVIVDNTPPALTLDNGVLTQTQRLSLGRVELSGTVIDEGLEAVTVAIDGGPALPAELSGSNWRYVWGTLTDPDGATLDALIVARDAGGLTDTLPISLTVDVVSPQIITITAGYINGGSALAVERGETVSATHLTLNWELGPDGSGLTGSRAGWTTSPTPTLSTLPPATAIHTTPVSEGNKYYGYVAALDGVGNAAVERFTPIYVDSPNTPDYISLDDSFGGLYRGWMDSGCSLVGADYEVARYAADGASLSAIQKLYLTWDETHLRLAWTGANWDVDGDLFIYLDTVNNAGVTTAYNPYGAGATITLPDEGDGPLAADYLIHVEDNGDATLRTLSGSSWVISRTLSAPNFLYGRNGTEDTTDLYLPFSWLGITSLPANLKLLALASEEDALRLWAAMPDHNPLNSPRAVNPVALPSLDLPFTLTQYYEWADAGADDVCPADLQFQEAALRFELTAEPAGVSVGFLRHDLPGLTPPSTVLADLAEDTLPLDMNPVPVGTGQRVTYTLHYANDGAATATGVVANADLNGVSLDPLPLGDIEAGASGSLSFSAILVPGPDGESAEVKVEIDDDVHAPFDWLWTQHDIDTEGSTEVSIINPALYLGAGLNTLEGVATDVSAVPTITLQITNVNTGHTSLQTCLDLTPDDGQWSCAFDAGPDDNITFMISARGTDIFDNVGSYGSVALLVVDAVTPTIILSSKSSGFLSGGVLSGDEALMKGTVSDDERAVAAEICAQAVGDPEPECIETPVNPSGQTTAEWADYVPIPTIVDSEPYTVTFTGIDGAGNRSAALLYNITADFSGPDIQITPYEKFIGQYATTAAMEGTITDGSDVASLTMQLRRPDNGDFVPDEFELIDLGTGPDWSHSESFDILGEYRIGLIGKDIHGNETVLGTFSRWVIDVANNVAPTADAGGRYVVNEGGTLTLNGTVGDINRLADGGQVITASWDLDGSGVYSNIVRLDSPESETELHPIFDATNIDGPDHRTISLRVTDGAFTTTVTTTVSIRNLSPIAEAGGPYVVQEGSTLTVSGSAVDPYAGDTITFSWDIDGDGVYSDVIAITDQYSATFETDFDATTLDGPAERSIHLLVIDDDGGVGLATAVISITNVAPYLTNLSSEPIFENNLATLTGEIVEPAIADWFQMQIQWGDGRGTYAAIETMTAAEAGIDPVPNSLESNQLLRLGVEAFREGGFQHRFENITATAWISQTWSDYDGMRFWYYGSGDGATVFVELYDNRNPGSTTDDTQRWRYTFKDSAPGWQPINILFTDVFSMSSKSGAPNDGLGLTEVWGWALGSNETSGLDKHFIDDFSLTRTGTETVTLVDNFEGGLPAGLDPNGVEVGFSTRTDDWVATSYFGYPAGTKRFTETHLYIDDNKHPNDIYDVALTIQDDDTGSSTTNAEIVVLNVPPVVSLDVHTQTLQYSDYIIPVTITATDVISDPLSISATISGIMAKGGTFTGNDFPFNLTAVLPPDYPCPLDNNDLYIHICEWQITGTIQLEAGLYTVTVTIDDGDGGQTDIAFNLNILPEDATIEFNPDNVYSVVTTEPGSDVSKPFSLNVFVTETLPDLASFQSAPGDINLALYDNFITLEPVGPGQIVTPTVPCTAEPVDPYDYESILIVECGFSNVPVNVYTVVAQGDDRYYTGYREDVLTVYDPSLGFTTGAGWIIWPDNPDNPSQCAGHRTSFGYSLQYSRNIRNLRGLLLVICNLGNGESYRLRSNALDGLAIGDEGAFGWASFTGKTSYLAPGMADAIGNYGFTVYVEDFNEPGQRADTFWLETRDKRNFVVPELSIARPAADNATADGNAVPLSAGNVIAQHSGGPYAEIYWESELLTVHFSNKSWDSLGTITDWEWDFGDGVISRAQNPTHTYSAPGLYDVTLTITDDNGASAMDGQQVRVYASNQVPVAAFNYMAEKMEVTFNNQSTDVDGELVSWIWEFGDGSRSSLQHPTHTYNAPGVYIVTLTVTDNMGATSTIGQSLSVVANRAPEAGFEVSTYGLTVNFNDQSTDADGTVASWSWTFGDGGSSSAQNPSHTYAAAGTYVVMLTVTDNDGATDTFAQEITVSDGSEAFEIHVSALIGSSTSIDDGSIWIASVRITVRDDAGNPVANAIVGGSWSKGFDLSGSCETDASGQCTIETAVNSKTRRVTFTVDSVSHSTLTYNAALNAVSSIWVDRP